MTVATRRGKNHWSRECVFVLVLPPPPPLLSIGGRHRQDNVIFVVFVLGFYKTIIST